MGTKKGQRRKTARRAYVRVGGKIKKSKKKREPTMTDWHRYKSYLDRKERERIKAGAGAFESGKWVPYDFKTWFAGWGR